MSLTLRMRIVVLALLTLLGTPAWALAFPAFSGLVVDQANILPADRKVALEQKLEAFQKRTGKQLVVATVSSLEGDDIQDYGYQLGRAWDVGLKAAGNGTILLVAPNERKVGIETASGVSGLLTDAYTSVVINSKIRPAFKAGDMPGGIDAGTDAIIEILSMPDDQAHAKEQAAVAAWDKEHKRSSDGGVPGALIFWLIIVAWVVIAGFVRRARYGQRYQGSNWPIWLWAVDSALNSRSSSWGGGSSWSGGGSSDSGGGGWMGGGFTGGGGGGSSFDGGGSSGSW
ncbi:TPM domain-containing protein [Sphingomonas sp. CGMCC 1.13654]|uniref:TPM domain-containing protein n=1 Tax=Sphingomonas chungangi TaxID=2683589 RepID=A0A838L9F3_9SPHN|nr:TPM domain-containing protein [Sphingomonas chungangi]MBA2934756.1 TPM domain-containing protein [Sphingomonas chungangi]MVW58067.1 methanol dehydrogenase [Sphingomonas chungangi]